MNRPVPSKLIIIQILRCLAAILIVVWHSHLSIKLFENYYWPEGNAQFRAAHFPFWANHLSAGVDIFFCISGFIMCMLAARSKNASAFILDRFLRIMPPYWFFTMVVIAVFLLSPRFNVGDLSGYWAQDATRAVGSILLIPQSQAPILGVGWTLVHEFFFYYFVAVLIFLNQGLRVTQFLFAAAAASVLLCVSSIELLYGYLLSPYYVEFFAGALAYRTYNKVSSFYPEAQFTAAICLYFGVSALLDIHQSPIPQVLIQVFGFGSMGFFFITGLIGINSKHDLSRFSLPRLLARLGNASYSLYLSHWFVLSLLGKFAVLISDASIYVVVLWQLAAITSALLFAVLFAEHVELPLHKTLLEFFRPYREDTFKAVPT